jgi:hypothetical protein
MKLPAWAWAGMAVLLIFGLYQYNTAKTAKAELAKLIAANDAAAVTPE